MSPGFRARFAKMLWELSSSLQYNPTSSRKLKETGFPSKVAFESRAGVRLAAEAFATLSISP